MNDPLPHESATKSTKNDPLPQVPTSWWINKVGLFPAWLLCFKIRSLLLAGRQEWQQISRKNLLQLSPEILFSGRRA